NNPGGWDQSTGIVTQFQDNGQSTQAGGITFTTKPESISNDIVDQIGLDQSILSQYGASNPTLAYYYNGAIGQLEAELAADNLVDPTTGQPINDYVMTVLIEPIFADAGSIFTQGTQLEGSGQWVAPSDASVTITNYTPAYLDIFGITIPLSNGGLFYNGLPEGSSVGNSDIGATIQLTCSTSNKFCPLRAIRSGRPARLHRTSARYRTQAPRRRSSSSTMCSMSISTT